MSKVTIENFRGIKSTEIELDRDITVLVGENNSGKTSILEALHLCLDLVRSERACNFSEYDFYRDDTCQNIAQCQPINLTIRFMEAQDSPWPEHVLQTLNEVIVGREHAEINYRVTAEYDIHSREIQQRGQFLNETGEEMVGKSRMIEPLRKLRPFFYQYALRAAKDQFHGQAKYWSSFLGSKDIDDTVRQALEDELFRVNQKIVNTHASFKDVAEEIERISELVMVGEGDAVTIDPAPADVYKSLRHTDVNVLTPSKAKVPIRSHGEGTQSLSILLLFSAYLKRRLKYDTDMYDRNAEAIIAIEEPEAHLHPNAVRTVWQLIKDMPGQKIIATHSGDMLSEVPVERLRRIDRVGSSIKCNSISNHLLSSDMLRKFNHHVRRNRGELLFAKCWLLVEGETDVLILAECAELLEIDFHRYGIRIIEYSQAGGPGLFITVADALGISWHLVADGDDAGDKYAGVAKDALQAGGTTEARDEADHVTVLPVPNMDILLCSSGYGDPYMKGVANVPMDQGTGTWEEVMDELQSTFEGKPEQALRVVKRLEDRSHSEIDATEGGVEYWTQVYRSLGRRFSKPAAAMEAVLLMREKIEEEGGASQSMPRVLADILNKALRLVGK